MREMYQSRSKEQSAKKQRKVKRKGQGLSPLALRSQLFAPISLRQIAGEIQMS